MHFNDDFPKWLFRKAQFRERKEKHFLEATFLAPRRIYIYIIHLYFEMEFYLKIKMHSIQYQQMFRLLAYASKTYYS